MQRTMFLGLFFWIVVILSCVLGVFFFMVPLLPILLISKTVYRHLIDRLVAFYIIFVTAWTEIAFGIKIVVSGVPITPGINSLILMNHRTRLDWFFFWNVLWRYDFDNLVQEKISLKHPLKFLPGLGWATQFCAFMFLKRDWEKDKVTIANIVDYYKRMNTNTHILFYPEGTDLCANTMDKSNAFAKKAGLETYDYVLHPRTTGFSYLYKQMVEQKQLDIIYDVTIAYKHSIPQNELAMMGGKFPEEVHYHVRQYQRNQLPVNDNDLQTWCRDLFKEKEQILQRFYTEEQQFDSESTNVCSPDRKNFQYFALLFWSVFTLLACYSVITSYTVLTYTIICSLMFIIVGRKYDGFDTLQIQP